MRIHTNTVDTSGQKGGILAANADRLEDAWSKEKLACAQHVQGPRTSSN